ncbi:MAG: M20/M25/M40 family metallo-hydrolase [Microbacteriaceae bacterium]|nr:M20/M25/M40 family metallo-hydrolase [Microbacteriaceae bacterium]
MSIDENLLETIRAEIGSNFPVTVADLCNLVKIPSVSFEGFDLEHVQNSAAAVKALFEELELFEEIKIVTAPVPGKETHGKPAILARRKPKNGAVTVLLYAHHDVQPEGDPGLWDTSPFEPTLKGERIYGRGVADDKAGVMTHVAALRQLKSLNADPNLGLALFIEGEEESGSPSFANLLKENADFLESDVIIVADSGNWNVDTPAITTALRGNVRFTIDIATLEHASHSGMFGGVLPDATMAAIKLLSTFWNEAGEVAVKGLTTWETETPEYDDTQLKHEAAPLDGVEQIGTGTILGRIWGKPSVTVTGMDIPSVRNASNTLAPNISVVVSIRIAPGQLAKDAWVAIEKHIAENIPFGAHYSIRDLELGNPILVDVTGEAAETMISATEAAWNETVVLQGVGGSIPFIAELKETYPKAEVLVTGVEDPQSMAHSPNESLHLGVFRRGIESEALFLATLDSSPYNG